MLIEETLKFYSYTIITCKITYNKIWVKQQNWCYIIIIIMLDLGSVFCNPQLAALLSSPRDSSK